MTREEHLAFCKKCTHQKMDLQQGIVCALTQRQADFQNECSDYILDESIDNKPMDNEEAVDRNTLHATIDPEALEKLRSEQNFSAALITGIIVGFLGAIVWAAITVSTQFQIGFMALAIGFIVGHAVRISGKGMDPIYGYLGAIIALLSCVLGNVFGIIGFAAEAEGLGYFETLFLIDYSLIPEILIENFGFIDIIFYAIAIAEGYKFSFRRFTEEDLQKLVGSQQHQ